MSEASFCWQCGGKLILPHFAEVTDRFGNVLRVHKVCKESAEQLSLTVQESERPHDLLLAEERL